MIPMLTASRGVAAVLAFLAGVQSARAFRGDDADKIPPHLSSAPASYGKRALSSEQSRAASLGLSEGLRVEWHPQSGIPVSIRGLNLAQRKAYSGGKGLSVRGGTDFHQDALAVLDNLSRFYGIRDAENEFSVRRSDQDRLGFHHVRITQRYNGLPVFGGEMVVHFNKAGTPYEVNGAYVPDIALNTIPGITADDAVLAARADLGNQGKPGGTLAVAPSLVIYARDVRPRLAFELTLDTAGAQAGPGRWRYWIDAQTGAVLMRYNNVAKIAQPTANGAHTAISGVTLPGEGGFQATVEGWRQNTGYFYLYNTNAHWIIYNTGSGAYPDALTYAFRTTADWGASDPVEMSAAVNLDIVQRYYRGVFGLNSFDNAAAFARANVHEGTDYVNAYWDGTELYFGDGDGIDAHALGVLDVCGHEFTHAVTEYSANLVYAGESGALNESFSDVMGASIEFYAQADDRGSYPSRSPGSADWLLAEDCWLASVALRDMRNPANSATVGAGNEQPTRYKGNYWYSGPGDNGGVHQNSGVQNFFYYLLSEGGTGDNDGIAYSVPGIGVTNAQLIAFRALTVYCTANTDYPSVRSAWISAALDLNPAWAESVGAAWSAVGVGPLLVSPGSIAFRGPVGGPFGGPQNITLINRDTVPLNWTLTQSDSWIDAGASGGAIPAANSDVVTISVNAAANALASGIYTNTLRFSNSVDSAVHTVPVKLLVGQPDYFTELFDDNPNDLAFQTWTFVPDGGASVYSVCRQPAVQFPTDPTGGTEVSLGDDDYQSITLTGTNSVAIYNRRGKVLFIGSNGYITMDSGDDTFQETLADHFNRPRISGWFHDLDPTSGGTISWKQTDELVAVTFSGVSDYDWTGTISFQVELFYDGRIRITYLEPGLTYGLAGISAGTGVPDEFAPSDLTSYAECPPPDDLVVAPHSALVASGYEGGSFTPSSVLYSLSNAGPAPVPWAAGVSQTWLTLSSTGGTLGSGASASLVVSINAQAESLPPGNYSGVAIVTNLLSGFTSLRTISLRVLAIPGEIGVTDSILPAGDLQLPFGDVRAGFTRTEQLTITNSDPNHAIVLSSIVINGGGYLEDFTDGEAQGWTPDRPADWHVIAGEYRAQTSADEFLTSVYSEQQWSDLTLQAACRRSGSSYNSASIVLRASPDFDDEIGSGYVFQITTDGNYSIWKQVNGTWSWLQSWTTSAAIQGTSNVLAASAQGSTLRFYINGTPVWTGTDSSIDRGGIALMGYSVAGEVTTHYFDNIAVTAPGAALAIGPGQGWYNQHPLGGDRLRGPGLSAPNYPGKPDRVSDSPGILELTAENGPWSFDNLPAFPYSIEPGKALTLNVAFAPTIPGSNSATVVIVNNDADEPRIDVGLSGFVVPDVLRMTPASGFASHGAPGGPFTPLTAIYTLSNSSPDSLNWTAVHTQTWTTVSPQAGTLGSGQWTNLTVNLSAEALSLATGEYTDLLVVSNLVTGAALRRGIDLSVRPDGFTELFDTGDNDLAFQKWTFSPNGGGSFYSACREPATAFPTDPAGGTQVNLSDDTFAKITLAAAHSVAIFNRRTNVLFIGSNGYLTMDSGDTSMTESISTHFNRPRVSGCFHDLYPASGSVTWKETSELVAITFLNVREYDSSATISFQIELFYDGRIRLTWLDVNFFNGLAGLSAGAGVPPGFVESDLTRYGSCLPADDLVVTPTDEFISLGAAGGPFLPPAVNYTLTNSGGASLAWSAFPTQPWLTMSPSSGSLSPGEGATVGVALNANAQALPIGTHTSSIVFSNHLTQFSQARQVQLTIAEPAITVLDAESAEGNSGLVSLEFPVILMPPSTQLVSVTYATLDGTALASSDYVPTNGILQFTPGQTNRTLTVYVRGDTDSEPDEALSIVLSAPVHASLKRPAASGTIIDDDGTSVFFPYNLSDGESYLWDIRGDGSVFNGSNDAFDGGLELSGFPSYSTGLLVGERELILGPSSQGGLQITRRIYVPENHGYARFLEVLRNEGIAPINTVVKIDSNLGSDSATVVVATSSGDGAFTTADNWLVTDDADGANDPTLLHVIANDSGMLRPSSVYYDNGYLGYEFSITVPPGETRIVMHFASQNPNRTTALAKAPQLEALLQDALAAITPGDLSRIVNFGVTPATTPSLVVSLAGTNLVISWPASVSGQIEATENLSIPTSWSPIVPQPAVLESNGMRSVTLPVPTRNCFYRLAPVP